MKYNRDLFTKKLFIVMKNFYTLSARSMIAVIISKSKDKLKLTVVRCQKINEKNADNGSTAKKLERIKKLFDHAIIVSWQDRQISQMLNSKINGENSINVDTAKKLE